MKVRYSLLAALAALGGAADVWAADVPPPPPVYAPAGPAAPPGAGCPTCAGPVAPAGRAKSTGHSLHGHKNQAPYVTSLCPGACFGYFQTQWRKWDEVCPMPYQGAGVSDAPKPPSPQLPSASDRPPADKKGGALPDPRPLDPKWMPIPTPPSKEGPGGLPQVPVPPGGG